MSAVQLIRQMATADTSESEDFETQAEGLQQPDEFERCDTELPSNSSISVGKPPKQKSKKRWRWTDEMVDVLLSSLTEIKSNMEFESKDFEADLVKLYSDLREVMASKFEADDFGPVSLSEKPQNATTNELSQIKQIIVEEKRLTKIGYDRVKQKIKDIRQDYRKAVTEGQRSGSGRLVCENWDTLKNLWGGSPATVAITNQITSIPGTQLPLDTTSSHGDSADEDDEEENLPTPLSNKRVRSPTLSGTAKFVDNKRKMLEKNLSSQQRDQVYLNLAKEEFELKQHMVQNLNNAQEQTNEAFKCMSESIASVGKSIGDGLALLATALAIQNQANNHPSYSYVNPTNRIHSIPSPVHPYQNMHDQQTSNAYEPYHFEKEMEEKTFENL